MKFRGLLVAVGALVVLFGLLYWSNRTEEAREAAPDPDAPPTILDLDEDSITSISVRAAGEEPVVVERSDGGEWKLTAPEAMRADQSAVDTLAGAVAKLDSTRLVEEGSEEVDPATFGLDTPQLEVEVSDQDSTTHTLLVGDETPTGSNYFAKLADDPRIYTLASFKESSLKKSPWDLRDKRLLTFDSDTLAKVELTAQGGTVVVGKNASGQWQIVEPRPFRADSTAVGQVVTQLENAKINIEPTPDAMKEASAAFGGAARVATAKVTDGAGTQQIEVRRTAAGDYYARSSEVDGVYSITTAVGQGLDKGLYDLRNSKLFDFAFNEPSRIEIVDGGEKTVYEQTDGKWTRDGTAVDSVSLRAMMDKLRNLSAVSFPSSGFTEPVFEATVVWDDGADHVLVSGSGDEYFAERDGEPTVYELDSAAVTELRQAASSIQDEVSEAEENQSG